MILPAQELLVVVECPGEMDLVAGRTELGRLVEVLEEGLLVQRGLGFDKLIVRPLQQCIVAVRERIVLGFLDGEVGVPLRAVDVRDRVAARAGDARLRSRVVHIVELRIVEGSAEERHRIVTARAEPRAAHVAVPLERDLARLTHARQIGRVVERTHVMRRVVPTLVSVLMALQTIVVVHQGFGRDEVARLGASQRREEVFVGSLLRPGLIPTARVLVMQRDQPGRCHADQARVAQSQLPLDLRPGQPMQPVEPHADERGGDVRPIDD